MHRDCSKRPVCPGEEASEREGVLTRHPHGGNVILILIIYLQKQRRLISIISLSLHMKIHPKGILAFLFVIWRTTMDWKQVLDHKIAQKHTPA